MLKNEGEKLCKVVVCSPEIEYFRVNDLKAHNIDQIADKEKAQQQHGELKKILTSFGCEVVDIPELHEHPNSIFTRDTALCTPNGYIKLRMGLETRRGEEDWISKVLDSLGEPIAGEIKEPGTVEGGDVILAGNVAFIGQSSRTNLEGVKQISNLLRAMGYEIRSITISDQYLHIGGAMSMIGPKSILCCKGVFPKEFFKGFDIIEISCNEYATANVICLGNNEVVANSSNIEVINRLEEEKFKVHALDLSEFTKGRGGPSCLVLPVERKDF